MRIFKKGKLSNLLGNKGITCGFFFHMMSLDRQFFKEIGQKQNLKKKLKILLDTFFPEIIELE